MPTSYAQIYRFASILIYSRYHNTESLSAQFLAGLSRVCTSEKILHHESRRICTAPPSAATSTKSSSRLNVNSPAFGVQFASRYSDLTRRLMCNASGRSSPKVAPDLKFRNSLLFLSVVPVTNCLCIIIRQVSPSWMKPVNDRCGGGNSRLTEAIYSSMHVRTLIQKYTPAARRDRPSTFGISGGQQKQA
jgi:hypothetical protein